jgi:ABC-type sugar transport system permease subunit
MTTQATAVAEPRSFFTPHRIRRIREAGLGYLFLLPAFAILAVFEFFPVFYGLGISLCTFDVKYYALTV